MQPLPKLVQLIRDNISAPKSFRVENKSADEATVYLYDAIGAWFGIAAADFVQELNGLKAPRINVRINSPGGDVFEARAIATAMRAHKSEIVVRVDGVAASAAATVAVAGNRIEMAEGAFMMIHNAWSVTIGNAVDHMEMAQLLEKVDMAIVNDFARKSGKTGAEIADAMGAETWFSAQEAVDFGLADAVSGAGAGASNQWNLSAYQHTPITLTQRVKNDIDNYDRAGMERRLQLIEKIA